MVLATLHCRWLIASDRPEEATEIIKKAAKVNGKSVPDHMLIQHSDGGANAARDSEDEKVTVVDLFRPTLIMKRSFNMFYQVIGYGFLYVVW